VSREVVDHGAGESEGASAGPGLWRSDLQLAGNFGHDLGHFDGAAQQVDALAS
jgi:hypothetical protein